MPPTFRGARIIMFKPIVASHLAQETLFELFHENTKYTRAHYESHAERISRHLHSRQSAQAMSRNFKVYRFAPKIPLPSDELAVQSPLRQALGHRVSTRSFSGESISLDALAAVLVPAAACNRAVALTEFPPLELHLRSYPSAGGEYPVELYPVLLRVGNIEPAATHFDPRARALSVIHRGRALTELQSCLMRGDSLLESAAVLIVLTAVFERSTEKYGDRGYRLILLEAGHLAQNLCLTAAAAGLGTLAWGGFFDDELNHFLGIDGVNEAVVHCVFLGGTAR
jgi:SagB-type dehydrogenase family enzyme